MFATVLAFCALWLAVPMVFYALCALLFVIVVIGLESSKSDYDAGLGFWATVGSLGLVGLVGYKFGITLEAIENNIVLDVIGFGGYFIAGIVWSFAKWYFHLSNVRDAYQAVKAGFMEKYEVTAERLATPLSAPPEALEGDDRFDEDKIKARQLALEEYKKERDVLENFFSRVENNMRSYLSVGSHKLHADPTLIVSTIKPIASKHKAAITEWIAFWPISFAWTMLNDPIRKIVNAIFNRIKGLFQRMSDNMFSGV